MRINSKTRDIYTSCQEMRSSLKWKNCIVKRLQDNSGSTRRSRRLSRGFFWIKLSLDVKRFIQEYFECQKVKPLKVYCKPKLVPLASSRTLMLVTMDIAGSLPITKEGHKHILQFVTTLRSTSQFSPWKLKLQLKLLRSAWNIVLRSESPSQYSPIRVPILQVK